MKSKRKSSTVSSQPPPDISTRKHQKPSTHQSSKKLSVTQKISPVEDNQDNILVADSKTQKPKPASLSKSMNQAGFSKATHHPSSEPAPNVVQNLTPDDKTSSNKHHHSKKSSKGSPDEVGGPKTNTDSSLLTSPQTSIPNKTDKKTVSQKRHKSPPA